MSDTKLVKEYSIADGAILTLMLKAAAPAVTPAAAASPAPVSPAAAPPASPRPAGPPSPAPPSLTISTEIDGHQGTSTPMTDANIDVPPSGPQPQVSSAAFHNTLADPQFWQRIHALCVSEFALEDDADSAWETFLVSMKGRLSAGEAAKIRDVVGVRGKSARGMTLGQDTDDRYGRIVVIPVDSKCIMYVDHLMNFKRINTMRAYMAMHGM